jgi:hypothetical protein
VILLPSLEIPKRVFTPAAITIIRELAAEGKTAAEIAEVVDSTPASVRVKCCQLKIQLSRRASARLPLCLCCG